MNRYLRVVQNDSYLKVRKMLLKKFVLFIIQLKILQLNFNWVYLKRYFNKDQTFEKYNENMLTSSSVNKEKSMKCEDIYIICDCFVFFVYIFKLLSSIQLRQLLLFVFFIRKYVASLHFDNNQIIDIYLEFDSHLGGQMTMLDCLIEYATNTI